MSQFVWKRALPSVARLLRDIPTRNFASLSMFQSTNITAALPGRGLAPPSKASYDKIRQAPPKIDLTGKENAKKRLEMMREQGQQPAAAQISMQQAYLPPEIKAEQPNVDEGAYIFPNPFVQQFVVMSLVMFAIGGFLYWKYYEFPEDEVLLRYKDEALKNRKLTEDAIARIFQSSGTPIVDDRDPSNIQLIGYDPSKSNRKFKQFIAGLASQSNSAEATSADAQPSQPSNQPASRAT